MTSKAIYHRPSIFDEDSEEILEALRSSTPGAREFVESRVDPRQRWPEMERLARCVDSGEVGGVVVVSSLHRLFRGPRHLRGFGRQLVDRGIVLWVVDPGSTPEPVDLSETVARLEELHKGRHSERVKVGLTKSPHKPAGARRIVFNDLEIISLLENGLNGLYLSYRGIVRYIQKTGGRMSKTTLERIVRHLREDGRLDDEKRQVLRRQSGRPKGPRKIRVSYDPDEIRFLLAQGLGYRRIAKEAQSLPRSVRNGNHLGVVRRIIRECCDSPAICKSPGTP